MSDNETLLAARAQMDEVDARMAELLQKRMSITESIASIKRENNIPIYDQGREQEIVDRLSGSVAENCRLEVSLMMRTLLALSRQRQRTMLMPRADLLPAPRTPRSGQTACAYQGVLGSWGSQAAEEAYPQSQKMACAYFDDVFTAVRNGQADYGIVPIENSHTGAIGETYDLLRSSRCYVVGRVDLAIRQCLLAPRGMERGDVRRVLSHPEALKQCGVFLRKFGWEQVVCSNTAVAVQTVAEENDGKSAAIGSRFAAELMGLDVLVPDVMDSTGNKTSFVVIATEPEYDENCNRISITFTTEHRSGALCETLMPFYAHGINLVRIESRPGSQDSYRFFADLEGNILKEEICEALRQMAETSKYFEVLGCYKG